MRESELSLAACEITGAGKGARGFVINADNRKQLKNFDWGPLGGFASVDLRAGYRFNRNTQVAPGVTNLLNSRQIEFVGSPSIARLFTAELKLHIPNDK